MAWLNDTPARYEADFSDQRLFVGRILVKTFVGIACLSMMVLCIGLAFLYKIYNLIHCDLDKDCTYYNSGTGIGHTA